MSLEALLGRQLLHYTYFACSRMYRRLSSTESDRDDRPIHWSWYGRNAYSFGLQERQWMWHRVVWYTFASFPKKSATACNRIKHVFFLFFPFSQLLSSVSVVVFATILCWHFSDRTVHVILTAVHNRKQSVPKASNAIYITLILCINMYNYIWKDILKFKIWSTHLVWNKNISTFHRHKYHIFNNISSENMYLCCRAILTIDYSPTSPHSTSECHYYYHCPEIF
jgi:hypothetical protein